MQAKLRCKRASKPLELLDGDPTIDANRCKHQELVEEFCEVVGEIKCQICTYSWILIQRTRRLT
jgi:hypothetical protein